MLSESQKAHARKISIIEGGFATVWGAFTGGFSGNSYLVGFFLWLGATPFVMSIYGALIPLASVIQPFSLMLALTKPVRLNPSQFESWFERVTESTTDSAE